MSSLNQDGFEGLSPLDLIDRAIELLDDERDVFLTGQYERLSKVLEIKAELLERIENAIHSARRSARFVSAVKALIEASRRNEQIIQRFCGPVLPPIVVWRGDRSEEAAVQEHIE